MDTVDIAWFAGLFEGEGCLSIERNGNTKLSIGMTDLDIIERVRTLFPNCNNTKPRQQKPVRPEYRMPKVIHSWRVSDPQEVRRIIVLMLPFLGERRSARAREVLEHLDTRPGIGSYQRNKTHCAQGHEYTPENTVYGRDGNALYRRCRTCMKTWWTANNAKRSKLGQDISA